MSNFKVYQYGLLPPIENIQLVKEQMYLAHNYYNSLIEIERGRRTAIRTIIRNSIQDIIQTEKKLLEIVEEIKLISKDIKAQHSKNRSFEAEQKSKDKLKFLRETKKGLTKKLSDDRKLTKSILKSETNTINELANELIKSAREYSGVYWGTYLLIEDAVDAARKMPLFDGMEDNDPKFVRRHPKGSIGVQLQGGLEIKELFGNDTQLKINPVNKRAFYDKFRKNRKKFSRTVLHIRVASTENKKPIWAKFPMIMHRSLPEGAVIKKATVHWKQIASKEVWLVDITVDMSNVLSTTNQQKGIVAIDLGWRDMDDRLRVAKLRTSNDQTGEINLPYKLINNIKKSNELRGIRDKNFDDIRKQLSTWLNNNTTQLPVWLIERTKFIEKWKSISKLSSLIKHWKENRFNIDFDIYELLERWRYHDHHLWNWENNQRSKSIKSRREHYRKIASKLVKENNILILEDFDLTKISQKANPEADEDNHNSRANKILSSPSELRSVLINAFISSGGKIIKVDPSGTSYTCHLCGSKEKLDHTTHIHTCSGCNEIWDRDDNATANIMKLGCEQLSDAHNTVGARNNENTNKNEEVKETRYERRARAKKEKKLKNDAAREPANKPM